MAVPLRGPARPRARGFIAPATAGRDPRPPRAARRRRGPAREPHPHRAGSRGDAGARSAARDYEHFQPIVRRIAMRAARRAPCHVAVSGPRRPRLARADGGPCTGRPRGDGEPPRSSTPTPRTASAGRCSTTPRPPTHPSASVRAALAPPRAPSKSSRRRQPPAHRAREIADALGPDADGYHDLLARASPRRHGAARADGLRPGGLRVGRRAGRRRDEPPGSSRPWWPRSRTSRPAQQVLALYYQEECTREVGAVLGVGESMVSRLNNGGRSTASRPPSGVEMT